MTVNPRPVEQWLEILGALPSPEGVSTEKIMGRRIIGDLTGYSFPSGNAQTRARREGAADRDAQEIANAMTAYARMMFDAGVRP